MDDNPPFPSTVLKLTHTVPFVSIRQQYAMKVIGKRKGKRGLERQSRGKETQHRLVDTLRREVAIMKKLRHRNIVVLREVIDDPKAQKLYMIQVNCLIWFYREYRCVYEACLVSNEDRLHNT